MIFAIFEWWRFSGVALGTSILTKPRTIATKWVPSCGSRAAHPVVETCRPFFFGFKALGWLVVWNIFSHILGIIIPTDFHIFQSGSNHQQVLMLGLASGKRSQFAMEIDHCWIGESTNFQWPVSNGANCESLPEGRTDVQWRIGVQFRGSELLWNKEKTWIVQGSAAVPTC